MRVQCSGCTKTLEIAERHAGKRARCPACQGVIQVPALENDSGGLEESQAVSQEFRSALPTIPTWAAEGPAPEDETGDTYRLSLESEVPVDAEPPAQVLPPRTVGKKQRRDDADSTSRTDASAATTGNWRDHFIWVLLAALIPLGVSVVFPGPSPQDRIEEMVRLHPEIADRIEQAESKDEFMAALPDRRLLGAHLPYDTKLHWGYALLSGTLFLSVLSVMSAGSEAGPLRLVWTGILTGTIGILLLLGFQWIAAATLGFNIRGRGIVVLLFYLVKLIGFSYRAALDPENGFLLSFLGFLGGVGFCEELCKALPVMFFLRGNNHVGWRAACLVGMASGIGFGISEGITYSSDFYNGIATFQVYLLRFASCVALHAIWAAAVAILMRENQDYLFQGDFEWADAASFVLHYLAIAMVLHGLYDTLLKRDMELWAMTIALGSFAWLAWLVSRVRQAETE